MGMIYSLLIDHHCHDCVVGCVQQRLSRSKGMPYYQRLDTGDTAWRSPLTPARAAGTVRIHGANPGRAGPAAQSSASGSGWRYTVGCFVVIPARLPCGHGAGAKAPALPPGSVLDSAQLLPGQVEVAAVGGIRVYAEAKRAGGVGVGGPSSVWVAQETAVTGESGGGSRGGSSGGGSLRARIPYDSETCQVR
jgi:hypothetical protein